jgi:hypothetical protein
MLRQVGSLKRPHREVAHACVGAFATDSWSVVAMGDELPSMAFKN